MKYNDIENLQPVVEEFLQELQAAATQLNKVDQLERLLEKRFLLSMNEGWGREGLLEAIARTLSPFFDVVPDSIETSILSMSSEREVSSWKNRESTVEGISKRAKSLKSFGVCVIDLSERLNDVFNPEFYEYMDRIMNYGKRVMFFFLIPDLGEDVAQHIKDKLSQNYVLQYLHISAPPIEKQLEYMVEVLGENGIEVALEARDLLKKWIVQKGEIGFVKGFSSLDKMCSELIYQKAVRSKAEIQKGVLLLEDVEEILSTLMSEDKKEAAYNRLNELIGMAELKGKVREIVAQIKLQKRLISEGKKIEKPSMHMMFLGNPGTGKTTVARIIGDIFKQEGLLSKGDFVEVTGNYFVEGQVADTTKKVKRALSQAMGSVLFVDEAYGMSVGHSNGNAADNIIPAFVEKMENHRDEMCIIFAGYKDEMEEFVDLNSGLKSRIPHILYFPNYSREELQDIFNLMMEGAFEYEEELQEVLKNYLESISDKSFDSREFSNARFVRNLYERTWGKAAYRINFTEDKEVILRASDMEAALEEEMFASMIEKKETKRIGFITT